ncbi:MAG: DUF2868 domain-containing protein [Desulfobacterales bacterium]|nr:DUF2868 domain-containing protein [Desulfobacterales bacterium]
MAYKTISTASIIDAHYFTSGMDNGSGEDEERLLYIEQIQPQIKENEKYHREKVISLWVKAKRKAHNGLTPGRIFNTACTLIFSVFIISGFITGTGITFSYLTYSGSKPVNIAVYIAFFVFVPLLLTGVSLISLIAFRLKILPDFFQVPYTFASYMIRKSAMRIAAKVTGKRRLQFEAALGIMKINREKYSRLYFQTFFKLFQVTGLMFSTGVLLATVFKVITTDLAFGWQTTLRTAPATIFEIVHTLSRPWAWIIPDHFSAPSLTQVEGSRIILKDGIENLLSTDLASWWAFLCLTVFFYTILPRLILYFIGVYLEARERRNILNASHAVDRIVSLLTSPHMTFDYDNSVQRRQQDNKNGDSVSVIGAVPSYSHSAALIPEDIYDAANLKELFKSGETIKISGDFDNDSDMLKHLTGNQDNKLPGGWILVCEAWMPPIKETLDYLKKLGKLAGKSTVIIVGLIGKPSSGGREFSDVSDSDFKVWQDKIKGLGDEKISLTRY